MNVTPWTNPKKARDIRLGLTDGLKVVVPPQIKKENAVFSLDALENAAGDQNYYYEALGNTSNLSDDEI
jgi:hypothetical protein